MLGSRVKMGLGIGAALIALLAAYYIVPCRLLALENGWYACGYLHDEHHYLARMQPLLPGATRNNPLNGIGDPGFVSQLYQDDLIRAGASIGGGLALFWAWRLAFIFALLAAVGLLARACIARRRPWVGGLRLAATVCGTALMYGLYVWLLPGDPHPPHLWLHRVPTNYEFICSLLLLWAYFRFFDRPDLRRGLALVLVVALCLYLRPYVLVPWLSVLACAGAYHLAQRRVSAAHAALLVLSLAALCSPWLLIERANSALPAHHDWAQRYFSPKAYALHPRWIWQLGIGLCFASAALGLKGRVRAAALSLASGFFLLPFITGIPSLANQLNTPEDRFACFYLPAMTALLFLWVGHRASQWRGRAGIQNSRGAAASLLAASLAASAQYAWTNSRLDLDACALGNHAGVLADTRYLPAYRWIEKNTPPDALFIVDDGWDWQRINADPSLYNEYGLKHYHACDWFVAIARRRVIFGELLWSFPLLQSEVDDLHMLQRGTFGMTCPLQNYGAALKKYRPQYVFWRKDAGVGRGLGAKLRIFAEPAVYTDSTCEIWRLDLDRRGSE